MFDKIASIANTTINNIKKISLIQGLQIGSGVAIILGGILINFLSGDELVADNVIERYDDTTENDDVAADE